MIIKYISFDRLPDCCKTCKNRDYDSKDEYSPNYHYCTKGLIPPTKKKECKLQEK